MQSPIDLPAWATVHDSDGLTLAYGRVPLRVTDTGYTVQVDCDASGFARIDGKRYDLEQFHFHWPGEHALSGRLGAAEVHLVHRAPGAGLAAVGVLLAEGSPNATLEPILKALPAEAGASVTVEGARVDPEDLLPRDRAHVRYRGSLTTPPWTEPVEWCVLTTPLTISAEQVATLRALRPSNSRSLQPLVEADLG